MTATTLSLFRNNNQSITPPVESAPASRPSAPVIPELDDDRVEQYGFTQSVENRGDLETCHLLLDKIRTWFEEGCAREQEDRTRCHSLITHEVENMAEEVQGIRERKIPALKEQIRETEARRQAALTDPDTVVKSAGFDPFRQKLLGTAVILMSAWLVLFYFLAAHVAWLRNLGSELQGQNGNTVSVLFETVFDLSAVLRDLAQHPANILVCILFPCLFVTIGYVTHLLLEKRRYGWLAPALGVTFGLDFAIAYGITMKLHEARLLTGLTEVPWRFGLAFADVNFYTVLLAGMGTYILWGLPLSFYLDERQKGRHLDNFLATCEAEAVTIRQEVAELESLATRLDGQVREKQSAIIEIDAIGNPAVYSRTRLGRLFAAFSAGWAKGNNFLCAQRLEQITAERHLIEEETRRKLGQLEADKRVTEEEKNRQNSAVIALVTAYKESLHKDAGYANLC